MNASALRAVCTASLSLLIGLGSATAQAEPGVSKEEILFGQSVGMTGPYGQVAMEFSTGIQVFFTYQNDLGGVNGRRLTLSVRDDAYLPEKTLTNVTALAPDVFGLVGIFGSPNNQAISDYLQRAKLPSVAPYTGLDPKQYSPWLFNVRAGYDDEAERIVKQLNSLGMKRVGVLYQNDGYGKAAMEGMQRALKKYQLDVIASVPYDRLEGDVTQAVKTLSAAQLHAVVLAAGSKPAAEFIQQMKKHGQAPQYFALSLVDAGELYSLVDESAVGVAISQVVPNPTSGQEAVASAYRRAMKQYAPGQRLTYAGMEGFLAGWVVAEGLKKAGQNPTRQSFVQALESLDENAFGGFPLHYQPNNHRGANYVEFAVIGKGGRLIH